MERLEDRYRPGFREYRIDPIVDRLKIFGRLGQVAFWFLAYLVCGALAIVAGMASLLGILVVFGSVLFLIGIPLALSLVGFLVLRPFSRRRAYDWLARWPFIAWLDASADQMFHWAEKIIAVYLARLLSWPAEQLVESYYHLRGKR